MHADPKLVRTTTDCPGRDPRSRPQGGTRSVGFVKPRKGPNAAVGQSSTTGLVQARSFVNDPG